MIFAAAFSRFIPHPPNFAPIGAMALFGAAYFSQRVLAFLVPLTGMWFSDLVLNNLVYSRYFDHFVWFSPGFYWTYAAFIIIGIIGACLLRRVRVRNLIIAGLSASVIFFLVSNFGVWASAGMYPTSISGLVICYTAGFPFFWNALTGDIVYTALLFGVFELAKRRLPVPGFQSIITIK